MTGIFSTSLRRIIFPTYDELTLFALSFTCVLFFLSGFKSIYGGGNFQFTSNGAGPVLLTVLLAGGIILSLYHSFSKRQKTRHEKQIMFLFAALVNGFSGIWGSTYVLSGSDSWSWALTFPIMNILSTYIFYLRVRDRVLEDDCIDDRNVRLREVSLSALIIAIAFFITRHYHPIHWSAAFSICVAYGTNLNRVIINLLLPQKC